MLDEYNEIWSKIKNTLNIKFHSTSVYDEKYIKAKVRKFNGVMKTNILGDEIPKQNEHYTCIACITFDYVMKMEKKNYPQLCLEECKYKIMKINMSKFIRRVRRRVRIWHWITAKVAVRIWFWIVLILLAIMSTLYCLCFKQCIIDGCFLDGFSLGDCFLDGCLLWASQKMMIVWLTLGKSKNNLTTKLP